MILSEAGKEDEIDVGDSHSDRHGGTEAWSGIVINGA